MNNVLVGRAGSVSWPPNKHLFGIGQIHISGTQSQHYHFCDKHVKFFLFFLKILAVQFDLELYANGRHFRDCFLFANTLVKAQF